MHRLLKRQLKKLSITDDKSPDAQQWAELLQLIDRSYQDSDQDRYTLERSLKLSSEEMRMLYDQQKNLLEGRLQAIIGAIPDLLFLLDEDGQYLEIRSPDDGLLYRDKNGLIGKRIQDVLPVEDTQFFMDMITRALTENELVVQEYELDVPEGRCTFEGRVMPTPYEYNAKRTVIFLSRDVTRRKRNQARIRTLSQAVEQSPVSVIITDTDGMIEYVNSTFEDVSGYSASEVIGKNPRMLKSGKTTESRYHELWQTITSGKIWQGELQNRRKNGEVYWEHANISPVMDDTGVIRHYLAVKEDITLRKQQEERILHQAHYDTLTDLPNRFLVLDRLSQLLIKARRNDESVAVLFIDLDDFKKVNDSMGHETGDKLLIQAADRLSGSVRDGDTVGRLGGDEFIILLGGLHHITDVSPVVENLLDHFRAAFRIDGRELIMTASVGISIFPDDGDDTSALLKCADSAMYHSKELGRNTYSYYNDSMNVGVSRRLALEEQMHGALDRHEFYLCYQPQIDLDSGEIMGAEALLRWSNPALGEVSPNEFIPIAEQTGLIVPIGQHVITTALGFLADLHKHHPFRISINLSPRQFRDPKMAEFIETAIGQAGVPHETVQFEITEGVLMSGHTYIDEALARLNDFGVSIAMDDFGTGYSSLSYLRTYPFDTLKIDKQFVNDIIVDQADRELVNATIAMAHGLGLKVIAEGIETEEQEALLKDKQCDYVQGYYYSTPIPAEEFVRLVV